MRQMAASKGMGGTGRQVKEQKLSPSSTMHQCKKVGCRPWHPIARFSCTCERNVLEIRSLLILPVQQVRTHQRERGPTVSRHAFCLRHQTGTPRLGPPRALPTGVAAGCLPAKIFSWPRPAKEIQGPKKILGRSFFFLPAFTKVFRANGNLPLHLLPFPPSTLDRPFLRYKSAHLFRAWYSIFNRPATHFCL